MKREQEGDDSVGSVKRLASSAPVVPGQIFVQPQHLTPVPLLPPSGPGSLIGAPTAVAISVQTQHGPVGGDQCLLGGTITYTQPNLHSSPCNIVLATPQPYVTSVPISHPANLASSCSDSSGNLNSISSTHDSPLVASYSHITSENSHHSYTNAAAVNSTVLYSDEIDEKRDISHVNNIALSHVNVAENTPYQVKESPEYRHSKIVPAKKSRGSRTNSFLAKRYQERNISAYAVKRSQESLKERQERLSQKFTALIRAKILELVRSRGAKKTVCPSEVARALSPKAWRDLMPNVRKIGTKLVEEGLILITQRGIIVDLNTVRGPVRFGLTQEEN